MGNWKIIPAIIVSALIFAAPVKAAECVSIDEFTTAISKNIPDLFVAKMGAARKLVAKLNENRAYRGIQPVDGKTVIVGYVKDDAGNLKVAVVVFDSNGCAIAETAALLDLRTWVDFVVSAEVEADDFVRLQGS